MKFNWLELRISGIDRRRKKHMEFIDKLQLLENDKQPVDMERGRIVWYKEIEIPIPNGVKVSKWDPDL